jgi:hypothetical protein
LLYEPLTDQFLWAQSYTVILLLIAISIRAMASGRDTIAGVSLAAASALKLFPLLILVYPLRTKRWRVLFSAGMGLLTISGITVSVLGWIQTLSFLRSAPPGVWAHWALAHSNVSLGATITQLMVLFMPTHSRYEAHLMLWELVFVASALFVIAAVFWITPVSDPDMRAFGLWVITATWIFPICFPAHLLLFLAFLSVLFCRRKLATRRAKWGAGCSYMFGVMLLPIHWTLLIAGPIGWLSVTERTCLVMLILSGFYSAWLFSRSYRPTTESPTSVRELHVQAAS